MLADVRHLVHTLTEVLLYVLIVASLLLIKIGLLYLFLEVNLLVVLLLRFAMGWFPSPFLLTLDAFIFGTT